MEKKLRKNYPLEGSPNLNKKLKNTFENAFL
jgi:hypothetical protein